MGQVETKPEEGSYGVVTVSDEKVTKTMLKDSSTATVYWTLFFMVDSPQLEDSRRGTYFRSPEFTMPHPFSKRIMTKWRLRSYPSGEEGREQGLNLYVEPLSEGFGSLKFSAMPLQMGGHRLEYLKSAIDGRKVVSHDGKALSTCLGGYRQVLESVKRPKSTYADPLYITFEISMLLEF